MKIVAGLGCIDDYPSFCEAGADEVFCGYVPYTWTKEYGTTLALNRREVLCYQVQLGAFSELEILAAMKETYKKPVHLTFNSLYYIPEQYPKIEAIIRSCMGLGFESYILADPALMVYLREHQVDCQIHLSGETGEINRKMVEIFQKLEMKRIIFHRKNTIEDMAAIVGEEKRAGGRRKDTEFEAFVLNELCQFSGSFCNSLHCDEVGHLCRVPYWLRPQRASAGGGIPFAPVAGRAGEISEQIDEACEVPYEEEDGYLCGESGCGLCALYRLQQAGITHLKLVGRGNHSDDMIRDIQNLQRALTILKTTASQAEYCRQMKEQIFPYGCGQQCYYR